MSDDPIGNVINVGLTGVDAVAKFAGRLEASVLGQYPKGMQELGSFQRLGVSLVRDPAKLGVGVVKGSVWTVKKLAGGRERAPERRV